MGVGVHVIYIENDLLGLEEWLSALWQPSNTQIMVMEWDELLPPRTLPGSGVGCRISASSVHEEAQEKITQAFARETKLSGVHVQPRHSQIVSNKTTNTERHYSDSY